jgi:hypothetical protein
VPIPHSSTAQTPPPPGTTATPVAQAPTPPAGPAEFDPLAGVLALAIPGLGHFYHGERSRALLIAGGILGLFFGGTLIGSIDVIDRRDNPIWFAGQALVGPIAFGMDYLNQHYAKVIDNTTGQPRPANPETLDQQGRVIGSAEIRGPDGHPVAAPLGAPAQTTKSLGRMNELGTLFATIAGMLNLIAVIDAAFHTRRRA